MIESRNNRQSNPTETLNVQEATTPEAGNAEQESLASINDDDSAFSNYSFVDMVDNHEETCVTKSPDLIRQKCEIELKQYRDVSCLKIYVDKRVKKKGYNDVLQWWKQNEDNFPILAELAKQYLAIEATLCTIRKNI